MNKIAIILNTCGIGIQEKIDIYIANIENLLSQKLSDYKIVVSSCLNNEYAIQQLQQKFGTLISYNLIKEILPVQTTFNHSVRQMVKRFGEFEGYYYNSVGAFFEDNINGLSDLYTRFKHGPYAIVATKVNVDSGIYPGIVNDFPERPNMCKSPIPEEDNIFNPQWVNKYNYHLDSMGNFIVPLGKTMTMHAILFSNDFYINYEHRILPDIFVSWCSESPFTFMAAALKKNFIITPVKCNHIRSVDGGCRGFDATVHRHDVIFRIPTSIQNLINPGIPFGMGYAEDRHMFMHNPNEFDDNGFCKNDMLKTYINHYLFLPKKYLDYDKVSHTFIPSA